MPVSEDEFERPNGGQPPLSKAEQRKSNKPIMEKRRRARINHCLNELKTLILDAMKKDPARHSKLEKADILEMTVKHLQQIQRQQLVTAVATDPAVIMRFKSGFDECAAEVNRYIGHLDGVDAGVKQRLTAHLHRCMSSIQDVATFPPQNMFSALTHNCDKNPFFFPNGTSVPGDVNNNSNQNAERIHISSGLQLIPSRLPTGELALLVPNSSHSSAFLNPPTATTTFQFPHGATSINLGSLVGNQLSTTHMSAFTAVSKSQDYPSPTSSADVIKKESSLETETVFYNEEKFLQNYSCKVTDEKVTDQQIFKKITASTSECSPQKFEKFKTFGAKVDGFDQKVAQRPSSSSFQRTVADSTTSFVQTVKERDTPEPRFKPFQVDIPDSHLKAQVSISEATAEDFKISLPIHQTTRLNFTKNPKKIQQNLPTAATVNDGVVSEMSYEKFLKIEPLATMTKDEEEEEELPGGEKFQSVEILAPERGVKRPFFTVLPEVTPSSSSDSSCRAPRISLNLTLKDDQTQDERSSEGRCKRISVIVEDSSKRESNGEVTVNGSSQKDMWRPW